MGGDVFRFLDMDTKLLELETGVTQNESVTWAVRSAIEAATLAMIEQGDERGFWKINWPEEEQDTEEVVLTVPVISEEIEGVANEVEGSQNGEKE